MFDNIRRSFAGAIKSIGEREITEKDVDAMLFDLEVSLLESDVALEAVESIKSGVKKRLVGTRIEKKSAEHTVQAGLSEAVSGLFEEAGEIDLLGRISGHGAAPFVIMFVGINGTGKTTTLAKVAHMLKESKHSVTIAAADTFRAGAIEQIREHTNRLGIKLIAQNYGSDPAAVARDAVLYAKSHRVDCVLIDTAGRMQTSKNLMEQISKIHAVARPDFVIFVGDALAGNDTINQASEFYSRVKFDGSILTKADADARGGAALSIVKTTGTPILYFGVGQEYGDLEPFRRDRFVKSLFGDASAPAAGAACISDSAKHDDAGIREPERESAAEPAKPKEVQPPKPSLEPDSKGSPAGAREPAYSAESGISPGNPAEANDAAPPLKRTDEGGKGDAGAPDDSADPFEGIETDDINRYVEIHDTAPPENDRQAGELAARIRAWISDGRPGTEPDDTKGKKGSFLGRLRR